MGSEARENSVSELETRLDGMEQNISWLRDHDLQENRFEAAKRLGLLKGDIDALIREVGDAD